MGSKNPWPMTRHDDLTKHDDCDIRKPTRTRRRRPAEVQCGIPIVDGAYQIVGWTQLAPAVESGRLRHALAERVLGGPIFCTQVALTRPDDIARAGGPPDWRGPWRCLALCRIEHARGLEQPRGDYAGETASASRHGHFPN